MPIKSTVDLYEKLSTCSKSLVVFPNDENSLRQKENNESIAESEIRYMNCHESKNIIINLAHGVKTCSVEECEGSSSSS